MNSNPKKSSELIVVQYVDSFQARQNLFTFYREVYPQAPWLVDDVDFVWRNLTPPLNKPDDTGIWLLRDADGRILGQNIYLKTPFSIAGTEKTGFCSTNLIVRPELVGTGAGHRLIQQNESFAGAPYAVGITPASARAFLKRGWCLYTKAKLHSRFIRPEPNLSFVKITGLKQIVFSLALRMLNLVSSLWSFVFGRPSIAGIRIREIETFDATHDHIWKTFLQDFAMHYSRTATFLNYKFSARESTVHHKLLFEIAGAVVGYGVYRISEHPTSGLRLGRIVDFVYDPKYGKRLISHMISVMVERLSELRVDGLVAVSSTPEIARALFDNGLFLTRVQPAITKETDFDFQELSKIYKYTWHITLGDSDLDNYW
ncbi:hypothetical protein JYT16_01405 [Gemmatimonas aurantiaca]|nr:hypothetical protein [Gemmatimonas aurantiaca]